MLLILDLDETLIHAAADGADREPDFCCGAHAIYRRPYLDFFLDFCCSNFDVAVWTTGGRDYARCVVEQTFAERAEALHFVWSRSRCVHRFDEELQDWYFVKDLRKLKRRGYDLTQVLIVDDTPSKLARNYGNLVRVTPFLGDQGDDELRYLPTYLNRLLQEENVRAIEKRNWRAHVERE